LKFLDEMKPGRADDGEILGLDAAAGALDYFLIRKGAATKLEKRLLFRQENTDRKNMDGALNQRRP
jgi:hypothetical protein